MSVNFDTWFHHNNGKINLFDSSYSNWKTLEYQIKFKDGDFRFYRDDVNADSGDIYVFKTNRSLFNVNAGMIIGRPLKTVLKTAYHLCLPISIPCEVFATFQREKARQVQHQEVPQGNLYGKCLVSVIKSLADIVRTPLYGIVLTVMHLAGAILYFVKPKKAYDLRVLAGKVELSLCWGDKSRCMLQCFQPMDNLMNVHRRNQMHSNIDYSEAENDIQIGLTNLALAKMKHHSKNIKMSKCEKWLYCAKLLVL